MKLPSVDDDALVVVARRRPRGRRASSSPRRWSISRSSSGISSKATSSLRFQCARLPSSQRMRVAELAVAVDGGVDDLLADAEIVGVVGRGDPEAQDVGAVLLDDVLRGDGVAERLAHLAALAVEGEAVGQDRLRRARSRWWRSSRAARNGTSRGAGRSPRDTCRRGTADRATSACCAAPRSGSCRSRTRRRGCRRPSRSRRRCSRRRGSARRRPA